MNIILIDVLGVRTRKNFIDVFGTSHQKNTTFTQMLEALCIDVLGAREANTSCLGAAPKKQTCQRQFWARLKLGINFSKRIEGLRS